jgi:hypothetical protein
MAEGRLQSAPLAIATAIKRFSWNYRTLPLGMREAGCRAIGVYVASVQRVTLMDDVFSAAGAATVMRPLLFFTIV